MNLSLKFSQIFLLILAIHKIMAQDNNNTNLIPCQSLSKELKIKNITTNSFSIDIPKKWKIDKTDKQYHLVAYKRKTKKLPYSFKFTLKEIILFGRTPEEYNKELIGKVNEELKRNQLYDELEYETEIGMMINYQCVDSKLLIRNSKKGIFFTKTIFVNLGIAFELTFTFDEPTTEEFICNYRKCLESIRSMRQEVGKEK